MRGKIFIVPMVLLIALITVPYLPIISLHESQHQEFDKSEVVTITPGTDSDGDGLKDKEEDLNRDGLLDEGETDPNNPDTDGDGFEDGEEYAYWLERYNMTDPNNIPQWIQDVHQKAGPSWDPEKFLGLYKPHGDLDGDGLGNIRDPDSDNDGLLDGDEIQYGTDPADPDSDNDGLPDGVDPNPSLNVDEDNSGLPDDWEHYYNITDPNADPDHDGLTNREEWENGTDPNHPGEGLSNIGGASPTLDDFYDIDLNRVLFYISPSTPARYWRLSAFDSYDKGVWNQIGITREDYDGTVISQEPEDFVRFTSYIYNVTMWGSVEGLLPTAQHTEVVTGLVPSDVRLENDTAGGFWSKDPVQEYAFSTLVYTFDQEALITATLPEISSSSHYLQVPEGLKPGAISQALIVTMGASTPYEKALTISNWLFENFIYDLWGSNSTAEEPMNDFILQITNHGKCTDFATAFVLLCRLNDIPARFVTGFALGELDQTSDQRVIREGHRHAWAEVLFEGLGWVPFEVTPPNPGVTGGTGVGSSGEDYSVIENGVVGASGGGTLEGSEKINEEDCDLDGVPNYLDDDDDNDGLSDIEEAQLGTDPCKPDTDGDGLLDLIEVTETLTNPLSPDSDLDGLSDFEEVTKAYEDSKVDWNLDGKIDLYTNPNDADTDDGGVMDGPESWNPDANPLDPSDDGFMADSDSDGLTDGEEEVLGTDPQDPDSDGDKILDGKEVHFYGTDPLNPDSDGDSLDDYEEVMAGSDGYLTDPLDPDTDDDKLSDGYEVHTSKTNPTDPDTDDDGLNDGLELGRPDAGDTDTSTTTNASNPDTDGDGLTDGQEDINRNGAVDSVDPDDWNDGAGPGECDPNSADTDGGGIPDGPEVMMERNPLDPSDDSGGDFDNDGLSDTQELALGTNITNPDTDGDGLTDGQEVYGFGPKKIKTNPLNWDTDGDGLSDGEEHFLGADGYITDPLSPDTDNDGLSDFNETGIDYDPHRAGAQHTDPTDPDSDDDGLPDGDEYFHYNTLPTEWDTDGGGASDGAEVWNGITDPLDPSDDYLIVDSDGDGIIDSEEVVAGKDGYITDPQNADTDGDGLNDGEEVFKYSTNPTVVDTDTDGLGDGEEVYKGDDGYVTNATNPDTDGDGLWDGYDVDVHWGEQSEHLGYGVTHPRRMDTDNDGLNDGLELGLSSAGDLDPSSTTDPSTMDTDNDGLPDGWYDINGNGNKDLGEFEDSNLNGRRDGNDPTDGSSDWNSGAGPGETDPNDRDTDDGEALDGAEVLSGNHDPLEPNDDADLVDSDEDGLTNDEENQLGTDPFNKDSDGDQLLDGAEVKTYGSNPLNHDTDGDGLNDYQEIIVYKTDFNRTDTDGDTIGDYDEIFTYSTNPLKADSDGDKLRDDIELGLHLIPVAQFTDPMDFDSDDDGLYDGYRDLDNDGIFDVGTEFGEDINLDGIWNSAPWMQGGETDPRLFDTDGGGSPDGTEVWAGKDPRDPSDDWQTKDSDKDGLFDTQENGTSSVTLWNDPDTDDDGLWDGPNVDTDFDGDVDHFGEATMHRYNVTTFANDNDSDDDGLEDGLEVLGFATNPRSPDTDGDGLWDGHNKGTNWGELDGHYGYNGTDPLLSDTDGDGLWDGKNIGDKRGELVFHNPGNPIDPKGFHPTDPNSIDTDGDELSDFDEVSVYGINGTNKDTDWGGLNDNIEVFIPDADPLDPSDDDRYGDFDNDGLYNYDENVTYLTNWTKWDTDGDGLSDGQEVNSLGTDPLKRDTDDDGLMDKEEIEVGTDGYVTNATNPDTDDDGLWDGHNVDVDDDGIIDYLGEQAGHNGYQPTDPRNWDTDGGGKGDGDEVSEKLDPNNPLDDGEEAPQLVDTRVTFTKFPRQISKGNSSFFQVEGWVRDNEGGATTKGIQVTIYINHTQDMEGSDVYINATGILAGTGLTSDNGSFLIVCHVPSEIPVGIARLSASSKNLNTETDGVKYLYLGTWSKSNGTLEVFSNTTIGINMDSSYSKGSRMIGWGILRDIGGLIVKSGTVNIFWDGVLMQSTTTSDVGTFTFSFEPSGDVGFHTVMATFVGGAYHFPSNTTRAIGISASSVVVEANVSLSEATVGEFLEVNGRVTADSEVPIQGTVEVMIYSDEISATIAERQILTDGTFNYTMELTALILPAGTYNIIVRFIATDLFPASTSEKFSLKLFGTSEFLFDTQDITRGKDPVPLTLLLRDNTRAPIIGAPIEIRYEDTLITGDTDTNGQFTFFFKALPTDPLTRVSMNLKFEGRDIRGSSIKGSNTTMDLYVVSESLLTITSFPKYVTLGDSYRITGKVVDDQGVGIESERSIQIYLGQNLLDTVSTDAQGEFVFSNTFDRSYYPTFALIEVRFIGTDFHTNSSISKMVDVFSNVNFAIEDAKPSPGKLFEVSFRMFDDRGNPIVQAKCKVFIEGEFRRDIVTGSNGTVRFSTIFPKDNETITLRLEFAGNRSDHLHPGEAEKMFSVGDGEDDVEGLPSWALPVVGLCLLAILVVYYIRWRSSHVRKIGALLEDLAEQLKTKDKYRRAIFEAYIKMTEILKRYDFIRGASETPREFKEAVEEALPQLGKHNISVLTNLFEEARYSKHKLGTKERKRAIRALEEISANLRGEEEPPRHGKKARATAS